MSARPTLPIVLNDAEIRALPTVRLPGGEDASRRVLWEQGDTAVGIMRIGPGGRIPRHLHEHGSHDIWVHDGSCDVLGRHLRPGSYAHVPAGVEHGFEAGPGGCTFLYLYRGA